MFLIIIILTQPFLNSENSFNKYLILKFKSYLSLNKWVFGFINLLLGSVLIILVTSCSWSINGSQMKNWNFDTPFWEDSTHKKDLMAAVPLTVNSLHKSEMKYHGKFGNTIGRIHHISIIRSIYIFYTDYCLRTQTVSNTLPYFKGLRIFIQYITTLPYKQVLYHSNSYDRSNFIRFSYIRGKVE